MILLRGPARERSSPRRGSRVGELEPYEHAVIVTDAPACRKQLHQLQPEATIAIGGPPGDSAAVALILDFEAHHSVPSPRSDLKRRAGRLPGVHHAVGDQLGHEQAGVVIELPVGVAGEPGRHVARARAGAPGPHGSVASRAGDPPPSRSGGMASSLGTPTRPSPEDGPAGTPWAGGTGQALLGRCKPV